MRFGFREFWIDGRDFYLNGTRIFLSAVPLDNAQIGAGIGDLRGGARDPGAPQELRHQLRLHPQLRLRAGLAPELRGDPAGRGRRGHARRLLPAALQPLRLEGARRRPRPTATRGMPSSTSARRRTIPRSCSTAMSHNATGYDEDMNPDLIDGVHDPRDDLGVEQRQARPARRGHRPAPGPEPHRLPPLLGQPRLDAHRATSILNFVPIQELSDWFEHWATKGVKPVFTCEYGVPFTWDWAMYRGWYKGERTFGSARVPWEFCLAEWNAQFLGDRAFRISEMEKANLRWEAKQFRAGNLWHRWDYPYPARLERLRRPARGDRPVSHRQLACLPHLGRLGDFAVGVRSTSGSCATAWTGARKELKVDWDNLQRPGFSPDYIDQPRTSGWTWPSSDRTGSPTADGAGAAAQQPAAAGLHRRQARPLHEQGPQLPSGRNGREAAHRHQQFPRDRDVRLRSGRSACREPVAGSKNVTVRTGEQERIPAAIRRCRPRWLPAPTNSARRSSSAPARPSRIPSPIHVLPRPPRDPRCRREDRALRPEGRDRASCWTDLGVPCQPVDASADLSGLRHADRRQGRADASTGRRRTSAASATG